jgi:dihydrofolate reductase
MTRKVIYAMGVSLDGYINGPDGGIEWTAPSEELHRFHNERVREVDTQLLGRRLYEAMLYWETAADSPSEIEREFARIWLQTERIVFSRTLTEVEGDARLAQGDVAAEVSRLSGTVAVGGAGLAASLVERDLIDEYELFVYPAVVGGGTPYLPPGVRLDLRLAETRTFGLGVVYLRYVK